MLSYRVGRIIARALALAYDFEMKSDYTAIVKQDADWWIGWVEEVPGVNAQERTKEELMNSLRVALREAIEFNREDARKAVQGDFEEEPFAL